MVFSQASIVTYRKFFCLDLLKILLLKMVSFFVIQNFNFSFNCPCDLCSCSYILHETEQEIKHHLLFRSVISLLVITGLLLTMETNPLKDLDALECVIVE